MIAPNDHTKLQASQRPRRVAATALAIGRPDLSQRAMTPRATFRDLGAIGLAPAEAANLTAYLRGLRPVQSGWTLAEIDRLLFLRFLVEKGRIAS